MSAGAPDLIVETARGDQPVSVETLLDPSDAEEAAVAANRWIKSLRRAAVDGQPLRDRFTFRGDSLWWFAEIYLHKRQTILKAQRTLRALERLAEGGPAGTWVVHSGDAVVAHLAPLVAARRGRTCRAGSGPTVDRWRHRVKALFHTGTAVADRLRLVDASRLPDRSTVAAFLHSAFFNAASGDDTYTGPVLQALGGRLEAGGLQVVGLGPRTSYRVRRWRDRVREFTDPDGRRQPFTPVEAFAGWQALQPSLGVWRMRRDSYEALARSDAIREAAALDGYDVWPLVEPELEGIAALQFPWSARAMDEAGAALDRLRPDVALTYAEAGGWGRALILEARRRGVPTAALQHGFIYRHWLNYQHEPDEMTASPGNPADRGYPCPTLTMVFDELAAAHLRESGCYPASSIAVTGSPRLDALAAAAAGGGPAARDDVRQRLGVAPGGPYERLVVVASKYTQIGGAFPELARAVSRLPVLLVVRPHPNEGPAPYLAAAAGAANVIAASDVGLAALLTGADLLVTVNSTAAIEAMAFDLPALVVGRLTNLQPFVEAGAMAGAVDAADAARLLQGLLYDGQMRAQLAAGRRAFASRYRIEADGQAARRAADAVLSLGGRGPKSDQPGDSRP